MQDYKKNHYVNNAKLLEVYSEWRPRVLAAREHGLPEPEMPRYMAESILAIAQHLSYKPNFCGYSWRDDFVGDGIENCIRYKTNFDPAKSSNIFAYFTTICFYAYTRRIIKEKKQGYIKSKLIQSIPIEDLVELSGDDSVPVDIVEFLKNNCSVDTEEYDNKMKAKRKKKEAQLDLGDEPKEDLLEIGGLEVDASLIMEDIDEEDEE